MACLLRRTISRLAPTCLLPFWGNRRAGTCVYVCMCACLRAHGAKSDCRVFSFFSKDLPPFFFCCAFIFVDLDVAVKLRGRRHVSFSEPYCGVRARVRELTSRPPFSVSLSMFVFVVVCVWEREREGAGKARRWRTTTKTTKKEARKRRRGKGQHPNRKKKNPEKKKSGIPLPPKKGKERRLTGLCVRVCMCRGTERRGVRDSAGFCPRTAMHRVSSVFLFALFFRVSARPFFIFSSPTDALTGHHECNLRLAPHAPRIATLRFFFLSSATRSLLCASTPTARACSVRRFKAKIPSTLLHTSKKNMENSRGTEESSPSLFQRVELFSIVHDGALFFPFLVVRAQSRAEHVSSNFVFPPHRPLLKVCPTLLRFCSPLPPPLSPPSPWKRNSPKPQFPLLPSSSSRRSGRDWKRGREQRPARSTDTADGRWHR